MCFKDVRYGLPLSSWSSGQDEDLQMAGSKWREGLSPFHWRFNRSVDSTCVYFPILKCIIGINT